MKIVLAGAFGNLYKHMEHEIKERPSGRRRGASCHRLVRKLYSIWRGKYPSTKLTMLARTAYPIR